MKLAYWMYAGPAHIGVLRVTSSFKNVHAIMHAPLGDDYFNVMRSMLERERDFTPVTASIVDRHVLARGSQEKVVENIIRKNKEESPDLILLTPTCTSSILQEDLHNFVERSTLSLTEGDNPSYKESSLRGNQALVTRAEPGLPRANLSLNTTSLESVNTKIKSKHNGFTKNFAKNKNLSENCKAVGTELYENFLSKRFAKANQGEDLPQEKNLNKAWSNAKVDQKIFILESDSAVNAENIFDTKNILSNTEPEQSSGCYAPSDSIFQSPDVILADVNHYRVNELQAADRTLEQIVRYYIEKAKKQDNLTIVKTEKPSVNIIGIFTLGFHNQHDCRELKRLFNDLGITINEIIPEGGNVNNLKNLPKAWFNFVPYREVGLMTAVYLKSEFNMPYVSITPMGLVDTALCIREISQIISNILANTNLTRAEPGLLRAKNTLQFNLSENCAQQPELKRFEAVGTELYAHNIFLGKKESSIPVSSGRRLPVNTGIQFTGKYKQATQISPFETREGGLDVSSPGANVILNLFNKYIDQQTRFVSQAAWFSRSIDCQNLTGKKAVVFGDATHAAAMTKILAREMGIRVSCAGTYCKHDADWFREQVTGFCDQILITGDHTQVGDTIAKLEPAAIFGTQMERHVGKRLDIPCGVISAPVHIQNFPLGYRPFLGYEGTNQIADLVYNSFNLGMEDHLLQIFGGHDSIVKEGPDGSADTTKIISNVKTDFWSPESLAELNKVPGFVRGKVKRNTEKYALQNNISVITVEVMYAAKEALSS